MRLDLKRLLPIGGVLLLLLVAAGLLVYRDPLWLADRQTRLHLWQAGVRSSYLDVDGEHIHYLEAMPPNKAPGTPLVLIHGLGARAEDWAAIIPRLSAAGFHVYVPDLLGYGRSPQPDATYSIGMQEKLVTDFMRQMHLDRADVAGWSMGGWIVMKLAADDPGMVNRMILFDSAGVYFQGYSDVESVFDAKDAAGVNRLFSMLTPHPKPIPNFVAEAIARRIQRNLWVIKRTLAAMTSGRDLMDFRLYAIKQPTLVVWGKQDALIPLSAGERIHNGIAGSSMLVVNGCGHLAPAECPEVSVDAAVAFFRAQPPIVGGESLVDCKRPATQPSR